MCRNIVHETVPCNLTTPPYVPYSRHFSSGTTAAVDVIAQVTNNEYSIVLVDSGILKDKNILKTVLEAKGRIIHYIKSFGRL